MPETKVYYVMELQTYGDGTGSAIPMSYDNLPAAESKYYHYTMCVRIMADSYYTLCRAPNIREDKREHEARVWAWFEAHREDFWSCRPEMIPFVMKAVNQEDYDGGTITYEQVIRWIHEHERSVA